MITQGQVKRLFNYDPLTGVLTNATNRNKDPKYGIGSVVGSDNGAGYLITSIRKSKFLVHRIIFLYCHGRLPETIDHIDMDRRNNKITNLRECTFSENAWNSRVPSNSTSGIKGVNWNKKKKKWRAEISVNGSSIRLGYFDDKEVAAQVVRIKRIEIHGEFANHG